MSAGTASYVSPASTDSPAGDGLQKFSCVLCSQRKVKCNRHDPCSACAKAGAQCLYVAPPPPKRGKRKTADELQAARAKRLQEALKASAAATTDTRYAASDSPELPREPSGRPANHENKSSELELGKLVVDGGRSKYIVNNMWKTLTDDPVQSSTLQHLSDGEESTAEDLVTRSSHDPGSFILGGSPANSAAQLSHPAPVQMFRLWQVFLDNVDPLLKIIHAPSLQQQIFTLSGAVDSISKPMEALMFSIYAMAVLSVGDADCDSMFGEPRTSLLPRYQSAARQALINANFLRTSDLVVLQAYFLFLTAIRPQTDPESFWALTGIAIRIAERMGLHKDGASHGLNPFQVELRRRLWWQLVILDGQTAQLTGSSVKLLSTIADTKRPLNINDSDLYPDMKHVPGEHHGPTQMCFVLLRVDTAEWLQRSRPISIIGGGEEPRSKNNIAEKEQAIDEMEARYEEQYIRNYDRSIPLHFMTMHVAALVICKIRWVANNPSRWPGKEQEQPLELRDKLLYTALKILECELLIYGNPALQRFGWHGNSQVQWSTFVYILSEVRRRCEKGSIGDEVQQAWSLIEQALEMRQDVLIDHKRPLNVAVSNSLLLAWEAYEKAANSPNTHVPSCVTTLRARRDAKLANARARSQGSQSLSATSTPASNFHHDFPSQQRSAKIAPMLTDSWVGMPQDYATQPFGMSEPFDTSAFTLNPIDWSDWDSLLQSVDAYGNPVGDQYLLR